MWDCGRRFDSCRWIAWIVQRVDLGLRFIRIFGRGGSGCGSGLEFNFPVGDAGDVEAGFPASKRVRLAFGKADDLRVPAGTVADVVEDFDGCGPAFGVADVLVEGGVDAFLRPARVAAGAIHEHDVAFNVGVVVDGGAPHGIGFRGFPSGAGREYGLDEAAQAGLAEVAVVILPDGAGGTPAVEDAHAGHGNALLLDTAGVVGEEEVEVFAGAVGDDGEVAVAAGEEAVLSFAIEVGGSGEDDAQVGPGTAVVHGYGGAYDGRGEVAIAEAAGFVVIPAEENPIGVFPHRFHPEGDVVHAGTVDGAGVAEAELVGAGAEKGVTGGGEDVDLAVGPPDGTAGVDTAGEVDVVGYALHAGLLGVGACGYEQPGYGAHLSTKGMREQ